MLYLHTVEGNTGFFPGGSLFLNGTTYDVVYGFPYISVEILAPILEPSGADTVILPAVLAGSAVACVGSAAGGCVSQPLSAYIANVDFDVPGLLTVSFAPTPDYVFGVPGYESFSAAFTRVPEPSTVLTVLAELGALILARRLRPCGSRGE